MITLFIIPSIKEYKQLKARYYTSLLNLGKIEQVYNTAANNLSQIKIENNKTLSAIKNNFDKQDFINSISSFFDNAKLTNINNIEKNNYITSLFSIDLQAYFIINKLNLQ